MRSWKRQEENGTLPADWKAQRETFFRYMKANAIYKTVIERKGRNALELLGFKHSFWGKENVDKVELESKKEKKSESAAALVKNLRSEISRLETLLSLGNH